MACLRALIKSIQEGHEPAYAECAEKFGAEIVKSRVQYKLVNLELPENRHFVKDYQLFTKSLVLVRFDKGRQAEYKGPRAPANSRGGA